MKKALFDHFYGYGRTRGFVTTHARFSEGGSGPAVPQDLDLYCHDFCGCEPPNPFPCEHYQIFLDGWKEGTAQAKRVFEQKDLALAEDLGRAAGFTSRRPPRHYSSVTPWHDGKEARLHGEVFRRFLQGWLQTGVDRRRIKGV